MQLWDRDDSVRNYAYLRTICVNTITTWRRRRNQEKMYSAIRSTSAQRRYAAPARDSPRRFTSRSKRGWTPGFETWQPASQDISATVIAETRIATPPLAQPRSSRARAVEEVTISLPAKSQICYDFKLGRCNRGSGCKFSHNLKGRSSSPKGFAPRSKSAISKESGICFYYAKASRFLRGQVALRSSREHECRCSCAR